MNKNIDGVARQDVLYIVVTSSERKCNNQLFDIRLYKK